MWLAVSGHRPEKISDPEAARSGITQAFSILKPEFVVQGMASGIDLWSAQIAYEMNIPYIAVKPWYGHKPRIADTELYEFIWNNAHTNLHASPALTYPGIWVYQRRNEMMVDMTDALLAVWDGGKSGGTWNCIRYAQKVQTHPIYLVDPLDGVYLGRLV